MSAVPAVQHALRIQMLSVERPYLNVPGIAVGIQLEVRFKKHGGLQRTRVLSGIQAGDFVGCIRPKLDHAILLRHFCIGRISAPLAFVVAAIVRWIFEVIIHSRVGIDGRCW